jgi:hypothetical protein
LWPILAAIRGQALDKQLFESTCIFKHVLCDNIERNPVGLVLWCITTNQRRYIMKKVMSLAAVALLIAGTTAFAGECEGKKAECTKGKTECSSEKSKECSKKADAKQCSSGCSKQAEA